MMSGAKVKNHDVLAQEWFYDLLPRPGMSIKVERSLSGRIVRVRSTEQSV